MVTGLLIALLCYGDGAGILGTDEHQGVTNLRLYAGGSIHKYGRSSEFRFAWEGENVYLSFH